MEQSASGGREPQTMVVALGGAWGWMLAYAVLTLILGIILIAWPGETLTAAAFVLGLWLFITGVFRIVAAFSHSAEGMRGVLVLVGILAVLGGVILMRHPFDAVSWLGIIIGAYLVIHGIIQFVAALGATGPDRHRGWAIFGALLSFVAGIIVLAEPNASLSLIVWIVGIFMIVFSIIGIIAAFQARKLPRTVEF